MSGRIVARAERPHECYPSLHTASLGSHDNDIWQCGDCQHLWVYRETPLLDVAGWYRLRWWHRRAHLALAQQRDADQ